jgi:uncharacterized protein (TIGR00369 family)
VSTRAPARPGSARTVEDRVLTVAWEDPLGAVEAARGRSGLELLRAIAAGELPPPPMAMLMGMQLSQAQEGRCTFLARPGEEHYNPLGTVHGGYAATLLDSAMGCAVQTTLGPGDGFTTLDLQLRFVRAITRETGEVRAEGLVLHRGGRVATAEATLSAGASGQMLAHATCTCLLLPGIAGAAPSPVAEARAAGPTVLG